MSKHTTGAPAPDLDTLKLFVEGHQRLIVQGTNRLTALAFAIHEQADGHPLMDEASHLVETIMDDFEDLTERLGLGKEGEQ